MGHPPGDRRAATLIEVTIALLFLALALVPIVDSILSGSRRVQEDRMRVFATALAASTIERYRLEDPAAIPGALGGAGTDEGLNPADASDSWRHLRGQFQVTPTWEGDGRAGILRVEVSWTERDQPRSIRLQTVVARTFAPGTP